MSVNLKKQPDIDITTSSDCCKFSGLDLISRQDAIDAICTWDKFGVDERCRVVRWYEGLEPYVHLRDVVFAIENLPSAEPERKPGHWIKNELGYHCSECSLGTTNKWFRYCPNCGAKMEEQE